MKNSASHTQPFLSNTTTPRLDVRMISAMRVVLALSALAIIYIDPSEPNRLVSLTYLSLVAYSLYSIAVYVLSVQRSGLLPLRSLHWIDLGWYVAVIALSSGTNSIFFFFLFFAILVASFSWGFKEGLTMTIASAALFTVVGFLSAPREPDFQLNRFLLRPIYLVVLGYLMAYWGGHEVKLKQRLQFLKNLNKFSNPRFGVDKTISSVMDRLCAFYRADSCLLIIRKAEGEGYQLTRAQRGMPDEATSLELTEEVTNRLLSPGPHEAVIEHRGGEQSITYNIVTGETLSRDEASKLDTTVLDAKTFMSVPVNYRREHIGRLYVTGERLRFGQSDVEFVVQVMDQIIPVLDNIRLVDELASDAAEQERQKIARDIHDGVVQPYIGVNLGLAAIGQKLERGDNNVAQDVKNLSDLVLKEIADWRTYIGGLKGEQQQGTVLVPAIRRFALRFFKATGIQVSVKAPEGLRMNDRLAAEVFYMVTESLSNIRRHTDAHNANVEIISRDGHVMVRIENEVADGLTRPFCPASLTERAQALGGELTVLSGAQNQTIVSIDIPL